MNLKEYNKIYEESSKIHVKNIIKYGPQSPFGYPDTLPEQLNRIKFIKSMADGIILDVGCDSGYILHICGGGIGIDISNIRLNEAKRNYPKLILIHSIAEYLPFRKNIFDTIIFAELLEHVLDPKTTLFEANKILKNDGRLIVTVPDEISGKSHMNPEHLRTFTKSQLMNLLLGLYIIENEEYVEGHYPSWCFCCERDEELW